MCIRDSHPGGEYLWNAKLRFGKTLSVYDFCKQVDAQTVLIVTNRPAIANSWYSDKYRSEAYASSRNCSLSYRHAGTTPLLGILGKQDSRF